MKGDGRTGKGPLIGHQFNVHCQHLPINASDANTLWQIHISQLCPSQIIDSSFKRPLTALKTQTGRTLD